jgi:uncharacterized membrane protein
LGFDCIELFRKEAEVPPIFHMLMFKVFAPFVVIILMMIILVMKRKFKVDKDELLNEFICIAIICLYLFYTEICMTIFSIFSCMENAEKPSESRLYIDLDVVCYEGYHKIFV